VCVTVCVSVRVCVHVSVHAHVCACVHVCDLKRSYKVVLPVTFVPSPLNH